MFGGALWQSSIGSLEDHSEKEREPPARPIGLEFPNYVPPFSPRHLDLAASNIVRDKICHVRAFTDISDDDLSSLNIKFEQDVKVDELLPQDQFQQRPLLFDEDLEAMLTEISVNNEDAYRDILRMEPRSGRTKPRLAYARNFFGSLEDMARYWDTSKDDYYKVPVDKKKSSASTKPIGASPTGNEAGSISSQFNKPEDIAMADAEEANKKTDMKEVYKGYRFGNGEQVNPGTRVAMVKNLLKMVMHKFTCRDHEPIPSPREKLVIRGVKIQSIQYQFCVARIPKESKLARARMVEGPLIAGHCREEVRFKQNPKLSAEILLGGATLEATGNPSKPINAKASANGPNFVGERFDFFREIGCLLILASQRQREGKSKDSYSGADKWWVTQKRWGGGLARWGQLAHEIFEDEDPGWSPTERQLQEEKRQQVRGKDFNEPLDSSKLGIDDLMANNAPDLPNRPGEPIQRPRKKKLRSLERPPGKEVEWKDGRRLLYVPPFRKKWYQDWQKLRQNTAMWDDKVIYKQIGKKAGSAFDDIYMITSVNHHIALVRMKVHSDYLAWLEFGQEVSSEDVEDGLRKDVLYVQRSVWYDMFDIEARKELLIALWRLMCWLNRENVDKTEHDKMQERRKAVV